MGDVQSSLVISVLGTSPKTDSFVIADLSRFKAFNHVGKLYFQSFDYSVERLDLSVRRHFPPYRILTAAACSKTGLAHVSKELDTDDFEIVAICLAKERNMKYVFTDEEDRLPASKVLPVVQLVSIVDIISDFPR